MDSVQPWSQPCESLDSEDSLTEKPTYLQPWIVNLLLDYGKPDTKKDGHYGHVLKVLNDAKDLNLDEKHPAIVLCIADGNHYIRAVVADNALQVTPVCLSLSGYSSIVGQFIILKNYKLCFREATKVEDCEFYLTLNCFQVSPMKRQEMTQKDCNKEPSVLKRIKELWQKRFALQPWYNSVSASEILQDIKEDKLDTLKQNVKDCLDLFNSTNQLNSEQLAMYPETKWQVERKQDKVHQNTFMVPAKFLVISAENEEILRKSYPPKKCQDVADTNCCTQGDDNSPASFVSAESESLNGFLENPWDISPEMTLISSSDISGTPPGLPHTQQVLLAKTTEEEAPRSSSCTPDFLESCAHTFHCNSEQVEPTEVVSPVAFPSHKKALLKESSFQDSTPLELNTAHETSKRSNSNESIPCAQLMKNSYSDATMYSPCHPPLVNDASHGPLSENIVEDNAKDLKKNKVTEAMEGPLATGGKAVAVKRKRVILDEDHHETFTTPTHAKHKAARQTSTRAFPKSNKSDKVLVWKPPLKLISTPEKSRTEDIRVQHHPAMESNRDQHLCECTERLQEYERNQGAAEGTNGHPKQQIGAQEEKRVRKLPFHVTYEPPTPEVCSQVRSTRISRALLGWACWVFTNSQGR